MKSSVIKKVLLILSFIALVVFCFINFYVYKDHRDINSESASFTISVTQLHDEFVKDANAGTKKYADKTIETYGTITSLDLESNTIVLDEKLSATMVDKISGDLKVNQKIKIKGRFVGYDDLLEELKMDQCKILN